MKPLITGGSGILGKELRKYFPESLCPSRNDLDITNSTLVSDYFSKNGIYLPSGPGQNANNIDKVLNWIYEFEKKKNY